MRTRAEGELLHRCLTSPCSRDVDDGVVEAGLLGNDLLVNDEGWMCLDGFAVAVTER